VRCVRAGPTPALAEVQAPLGPASEEPAAPPAPSPCPEQRLGPHQARGTGSQTQAGRTGQRGADLVASTQRRPPPAVVLSAATITPRPGNGEPCPSGHAPVRQGRAQQATAERTRRDAAGCNQLVQPLR
ncbi:unnamed protein product, partial [Rangifer tarandus platyrhynchus]